MERFIYMYTGCLRYFCPALFFLGSGKQEENIMGRGQSCVYDFL